MALNVKEQKASAKTAEKEVKPVEQSKEAPVEAKVVVTEPANPEKAIEGTVEETVVEAPKVAYVALSKVLTYVHSDGSVFRAKEVYEVSLAKANELLAETSPAGVPLFKEVSNPDVKVETKIAKVAEVVAKDPAPATDTTIATANTNTVIDTTAGDDEDEDLEGSGITITHAETPAPQETVEGGQGSVDGDEDVVVV